MIAPTPPPSDELDDLDLPKRLGFVRVGPILLMGLSITSGLLLWLSFFFPFLAWIAVVPLSLLIRLPGNRRWIYLSAWVGGFIFFLLGTYWVSYCAPWVWIGWLLLSAYLGCYFPLFVFLARVCHRRWGLPNLLVIPLVWVGLEYARMHLLSGFGWLMLAHSVYTWTRVIQIADTFGVYGVSFILALGNGLIVELLTMPIILKGPSGPHLNPGLSWRIPVAGFLLFLNVGYGQWRTENAPLRPGPKVAVVQTNVPQDIRNDTDRSDEYFRSVWGAGRQAEKAGADLVVFPETSYPYWYGEIEDGLTNLECARAYQNQVTLPGYPPREKPTDEMGSIIKQNIKDGDEHTQSMARMLAQPILLGTAFWSIRLSGAKFTNASVMITAGKGRTARYDKVHLVPFGEYVPFGGHIPFIKYLVPYPEGFNYNSDYGTELITLHEGKLHLAPLICFEDTIPDLTRQYMIQATPDRPVEILVNQSNDGWFNNSIEAWYHLSAAIFRCVEARRPMIRSSNTGLSNLVNSLGEVERTFESDGKTQGVDGVMIVDVRLDDRAPPYILLGDILPLLAWLMMGTCLVLSLVRQIRLIRSSAGLTANR